MESKNEGVDQQGSPSNNRSLISNPFTENSRQGYMGPEVGRTQNENLQDHHIHNHPHPQPAYISCDTQAILRDIERQRIRDEIFLAEMAQMRAELEVRIELLKQTESALQRGSSTGFPFGSSQVLARFDSPLRLLLPSARAEGRSLEERISLLNERREGSGGFEMPFQRGTDTRALAGTAEGKKKENIILLGKPNVNIMSGSKPEAETPSEVNVSGSKRKAETPPEVDVSTQLSEDILQNKAKVEWGCDLCPTSATSAKSLSEHLHGKKHKAKEARLRAQRAGKNYSLGLFPKEDTEPIEVVENVEPGRDDGVIIASLKGDKRNPNSDDMKNQSEIVPKDKNNGGKPKERKLSLWCNLCHVGNLSQNAMNEHVKGKKHVKRLREIEQNPTENIVVGLSQDTVVAENAKTLASGTVDEVLSEARSVYLGLTDAALKPEDHEPEDESKSKDIGALEIIEPEHVDETKEENDAGVSGYDG